MKTFSAVTSVGVYHAAPPNIHINTKHCCVSSPNHPQIRCQQSVLKAAPAFCHHHGVCVCVCTVLHALSIVPTMMLYHLIRHNYMKQTIISMFLVFENLFVMFVMTQPAFITTVDSYIMFFFLQAHSSDHPLTCDFNQVVCQQTKHSNNWI